MTYQNLGCHSGEQGCALSPPPPAHSLGIRPAQSLGPTLTLFFKPEPPGDCPASSDCPPWTLSGGVWRDEAARNGRPRVLASTRPLVLLITFGLPRIGSAIPSPFVAIRVIHFYVADKRCALLKIKRLLEWEAQFCNFSEQISGCDKQPSRKNNGTEV